MRFMFIYFGTMGIKLDSISTNLGIKHYWDEVQNVDTYQAASGTQSVK